ncbi:transcriptional regulator GcvA [Reyranella sp.]|uniref:transcriptional regulator GcvA n=1 Tax=Reyranella sp. TaxID=1929291 RepID=UPI003BAD6E5D
MSTRLPPLKSLRAFEAAARTCSFTQAAEELNVTQTAVSHQVKVLEAWLGFRLFRRLNNALVLTEQGELYLPTVREAFDRLRESTDRLKGIDGGAMLTISARPNFALRWLVPRLPRFQALHPGIRIKLLTAPRPLEALHDEIDVAIRFEGEAAHLHFEPLLRGSMFPAMHPALYEDEGLRTPEDLRRVTLLHVLNSLSDWKIWLDAAGVKRVDLERGPRFDSYALAAEAACHRWGVAMAWEPFVEDDLRRGRLVAPFGLRVPRERAWCLVYPRNVRKQKVELFRDWILAEARAVPDPVAGAPAVAAG